MKLRSLALALGLALAAIPAKAADLKVMLDWFVNPDHGPLFVALERGYFKEAGLDVVLQPPADPNDPPKLVAAKKYDLAVSYQPQLHLQVKEGLPLVRIATLVATPLNTILVLKDSPIKTLADLKGKRIGFSVGGLENALLGTVLARHGLTMADVRMVNVNWSLSPALITGKVDAVIGGYRNFELNQMDIAGHPGRAFYLEEEGVPAYDELIVVAHKDTLADPRFKPFVDAIERGVQYMVNHPAEAWQLFIRGQRKELDDELNRRAWADTLPRFALRPAALDVGRYKRFADMLVQQGLLPDPPPPVESYAVDLGR
jgi:putative hydroxymethylpyrimidine transport system substrate-binding protein